MKNEWEPWVIYMLNAVESTSQWTCNKINVILKLMSETNAYVKQKLPKIYSRELVDFLFEQPYCRIANVVEAGIVKRQTAAEYLKKLMSENVLGELESGREKIYVNPRFMEVLLEDKEGYAAF